MKISSKIFSLLLTWLLIQPVVAQPPSLVNFRGQLLDNSNQPVTDTVSVELKIFSSETGGTTLYTEEVGYVEVRNGQYAFQFGSAGEPDFAGVIKANAETWVEVSINNIPLSRQRFVSVPYALNAGSAQIASGTITRDKLSEEILAELSDSVSEEELNSTITEKLGSIPPTNGQLLSVPSGTEPPLGYAKISDSRIEWKMESRNNPDGQLISAEDTLYSLLSNSLSYYDKNDSVWKSINVYPSSNHTNGAAIFFDGKIYAIGGTDTHSCSIYDIGTGNWSVGPDIPSSLPGYFIPSTHLTVAEDQLYAIFVEPNRSSSTFRNGSTAFAYKLNQSNSWVKIDIEDFAFIGGGVAAYENKIFFFGGTPWTGSSGTPASTNIFKCYDITSEEITSLSPLPQGVVDPSFFIINDHLYVLVGPSRQFFKYSFLDDEWNFAKDLPFNSNTASDLAHSATLFKGKVWLTFEGTFSGTLVPAVYSYSGGSDQGTNLSANTSVTPSMLSESILKYLMPEIVEQPTFTGTIRNGTRVELTPGVEGKYISYQWYKDGESIDGATSQLFTIESFDVGYHDGNYTVVASNDFGEIESAVIELVEQQSNNQNLGIVFPSFLSDWTDLSNSQAIGSFFGVAIGENAIVACGIDGLIAVRNHESGSWETPVSGGDPDFRDVVFADNKFIAVGESGMIRTSQDGYSWTTVTSNPSYDLRCIVWDGFKFIIGASDGRILKSYDGTNWEATDTGHSITFNAIAYNGSAYIAVGGYGMIYSSDLINWSVPTSPPPSFSIESAAWTGDRFLVGGLNDKIYQSTDGQNWTVAFSHNGGFAESISSNGGATYVVGGSNFILSYDSESGNFVESNTDLDGNNALMDVSINGPNIVAVGFNHTIIGKSLHIQPSTHITDLNASVSLEMIWVEPGTFTMGSPETEEGRELDETQHEVTLTKGFYLGKYEVTQAQYEAVMTGNTDGLNATPSNFAGNPNRPVEKVAWYDIQVFLTRLNAQEAGNIPEGWAYVLPTEAQWEYVCRAGTTTAYSWGDTITTDNANYSESGLNRTSDVGSYSANPWGFFDMHGNVWEWTSDGYATYSSDAVIDPEGPDSESSRIFRGGAWDTRSGTGLRSAYRPVAAPSHRIYRIGFRVAFQQQ